MLRYSEILTLHDYFQPNYDLENERGIYWKQFVPNQRFFELLSSTLNSLEDSKDSERKAVWLQGTYGTGKSHAMAVIKHLLYDEIDKIIDYIECIDDVQLKYRLRQFREKYKAFPVILKGASIITDNRTFALEIERAVTKALKPYGISPRTQSDFEKMLFQVDKNPAHIDWEENIKGSALRMYVKDKEELCRKLKAGDAQILGILEQIVSEKGLHFSYSKITDWLTEVGEEIRQRKLGNFLIIYWDEFTSILQHPNKQVLLTELQNVADLSVSYGIYPFVITHRTIDQIGLLERDIKKIRDRFKLVNYAMEPVTTYHIVEASIEKRRALQWEKLKKQHLSKLDGLIRRITNSEGITVQRHIENLFPIHPYTAYIATFVARYLGSTERSIFSFLYDEDKGFRGFLKNNPLEEGNIFLTVDYLWDYFYEEFEQIGDEKIASVLNKYNLHSDLMANKGRNYIVIFKAILLLNILHRTVEATESSLVAPSKDNIIRCFQGTRYEQDLDNVLTFLDEQEIIGKTPDNLFLVLSSTLPLREIDEERKKLESEYKDVDRILKNQEKNIKSLFSSSLREVETSVFDASLSEYLLRNNLTKRFEHGYSVHLALAIGRGKEDIEQAREIAQKLSKDEEFQNVVFAVVELPLGDDTYKKFIEYKARAVVADKHNYEEERKINEDYAKRVLDEWVRNMKISYLDWYLEGHNGKSVVKDFGEKITKELSKEIFKYGLENLEEPTRNRNIWTKKKAKVATEIFLFAEGRDELEEKTSKSPDRYLRGIIKDNSGEYIVDANLHFRTIISNNHPLKKMGSAINEVMDRNRDRGVFNLGEELHFLSQPPYGLYRNMVNMAAAGFLLRKYVRKFYEAGTGKPLEKEIMRDKILSLFEYWESGKDYAKLDVRIGTEEEEKLIDVLKSIFGFNEAKSLNDLRWKIREWVKNVGYPLWVYKVSHSANNRIKEALDKIFHLIQAIDSETDYNAIKGYLEAVENLSYDLRKTIRKEDAESLFRRWLLGIENVEISDNKIEEVTEFLRSKMQEEVASWREDVVREKVKDWYIQVTSRKDGVLTWTPDKPSPSFQGATTVSGTTFSEVKVKAVKAKIVDYRGDIKRVLLRLVDKYPEIVPYLEKEL